MWYIIVMITSDGARMEFPLSRGSAWADHFQMAKEDVMEGHWKRAELWSRINAHATGERGEMVFRLVERVEC